MKIFKTYIFSVFIVLLTITSCTDDNNVIDTNNNEESSSIKTVLAELESHFNENGSLNPNENPVGNILFDFCFNFVYPITLTYNTGADVEINSFEELLTITLASTDTLFINGISFPFQVETYEQNQIVISTISNEQEFGVLILSCEFNDNDDCVYTDEDYPVCVVINDSNNESYIMTFANPSYALCEGFTPNDFVDCESNGPTVEDDCFEYHYPISVIFQNGTTVINSDEELEIFIYSHNGNFQFVYPFNVTINGSEVTINDQVGYGELLEYCDGNGGNDGGNGNGDDDGGNGNGDDDGGNGNGGNGNGDDDGGNGNGGNGNGDDDGGNGNGGNGNGDDDGGNGNGGNGNGDDDGGNGNGGNGNGDDDGGNGNGGNGNGDDDGGNGNG
ncbi:MAG: hypothetical protein L3J23_02570 [Flavobacteriaceae bacterium]|nr:hypothetical protein [Flavobacteriaceae bacterium]